MERRNLLAKLAGAAGAVVTLRAVSVFGKRPDEKAQKAGSTAPCALPGGGPGRSHFPNVVLTNQDYERARFYDDLVRGKIVTINAFATKSTPLQQRIMRNLVALHEHWGKRVGRDIFMYSITYDPVNDTPDVVHEYAKHLGVGPGWSVLTGEPNNVNLVLAKLGFGYMKMGHEFMAPHYAFLRMGNEVLDRWTMMPAMFSPHVIAHHLTLLEVRPERKNLTDFVRAGPFPEQVAQFTRETPGEQANSARATR
jgi:protein SCO1/2